MSVKENRATLAAEEPLLKKKAFEFPHVFVVMFSMMVIALIMTYLIPSGTYARVVNEATGRRVVDPSTFQYIDKKYLNPLKLLPFITEGLIQAAMVSFSVFIMGGMWAVINETGTIGVAIGNIAKKLKGRELLVFPMLMFVFAVVAAFIGAAELSIVYLPAIMPLMLMMGYDNVTAAAAVLCGLFGSFSASLTNPMSVGIAHQITGLPLYSGVKLRLVLNICYFIIGVFFVSRYAKKVKENPRASVAYDEWQEYKAGHQLNVDVIPERKHAVIGGVILAGFVLLVWGVLTQGWYMNEINGIFISIAFFSGLLTRMRLTTICRVFASGAGGVFAAAVTSGLARAILIILESGIVIDTVIHALVAGAMFLPRALSILGVYIAQLLFNFVVPSASGQQLITIPILSPMAELLGLQQQCIVLASQLGDGITNICFPTNGGMMAVIAMAGVPFNKWFKFIMPYVWMLVLVGGIFLVGAQAAGWGPF